MSDGDGSTVSEVGIFDIFRTGLSLVLYALDIILDGKSNLNYS